MSGCSSLAFVAAVIFLVWLKAQTKNSDAVEMEGSGLLARIEFADDSLYVHEEASSLSGTWAFKSGTIVIDPTARTISLGKKFVFPLPEGFVPSESRPLKLLLVDNAGKLKPQTRTELLTLADPAGKIKPHQIDELRVLGSAVYRAIGKSRQRSRDQKDGWVYRVIRFRAYMSHPGIETDKLHPPRVFGDTRPIPESYWLSDTVHRNRLFWNRLVARCEYARGLCETAPIEEVRAFVNEVVLPAIDAMNLTFDRSQSRFKMKYPRHLKIDRPSTDSLWRFAYRLKRMAEEGVPVPVGLEDQIREFIAKFPIDRKPIFDFYRNFKSIAAEEAKNFQLKGYEAQSWIAAFKRVLDARSSKEKAAKGLGEHLPFSAGWPKFKMGESDLDEDWGIHVRVGQANVSAEAILHPLGIPGIRMGDPVEPAVSGHPLMGRDPAFRKQADRRKLRQATISLDQGTKVFRFAVLQHQDIPDGAFVKAWRLLHKRGVYWLCYVLEVQNPASAIIGVAAGRAAGLDTGWRQVSSGMRIGMLWDCDTGRFQEITVSLSESPGAVSARRPFHIAMGPSRHGRETLRLIRDARREGMEHMLPAYHDRGVDTFQGLVDLQTRRNAAKDRMKRRVTELMEADTPAQWEKTGLQGLRRFVSNCGNPSVVEELREWIDYDEAVGANYARLWAKVISRRDRGYEYVAHDIGKLLWGRIARLGVETKFLKKMNEHQSNADPEAVKRSQKYRQWAGLGSFLSILGRILAKYGITVVEVDSGNTTLMHRRCGHVMQRPTGLRIECPSCCVEFDQDENAAENIGVAAHEMGATEVRVRTTVSAG